jgi:hypothetical protein
MMRLPTAAKYKMMSEYCTMEEVALILDPKASMIILAKNATIGKYDNGTKMFRSERFIVWCVVWCVLCGAGYVMMRFNCLISI